MKKMNKVFVLIVVAFLIMFIVSGIVLFNNFQIFNNEEILLDKCVTKDGISIEAYHIMAGATTNEVIQVKKKDDKRYTILKAFENRNKANLILVNDTLVKVVLRYTDEGKPDTVLLNIQ